MTLPTLQQRIEKLKELDARRTQGHWVRKSDMVVCGIDRRGDDIKVAAAYISGLSGSGSWAWNATFIAAAPQMMAVINELEAKLKMAEKSLVFYSECSANSFENDGGFMAHATLATIRQTGGEG